MSTADPLMKDVLDYLRNERKVKYIIHLTPVSNLPGILTHGLVPRSQLDESQNALMLDDIRLDRHEDRNCFSLSFPNYKMMRYKRQNKDAVKRDGFAIVLFKVEVLELFSVVDVHFYQTNAARAVSRGDDNHETTGLAAVRTLFADEVCYDNTVYQRKALPETPIEITTDPQAEVQIAGTLPAGQIHRIVVDGKERCTVIKNSKEIPAEFDRGKIVTQWHSDSSGVSLFDCPNWWPK